MDRNTELELRALEQEGSSCRAQQASLIAIDGGFLAVCLSHLFDGKAPKILWAILVAIAFVVFAVGYYLFLSKQKSVERRIRELMDEKGRR